MTSPRALVVGAIGGAVVVGAVRLLVRRLRAASANATGGSGIGVPLPRAPEHGTCIYLDYQATTPVWPEVAEAAIPYLRLHWGNPSSGHAFGKPTAAAVKRARAAVARLIGASADEILFTACGSEADNHAIVGAIEAEEARRRVAGVKAGPLPRSLASVRSPTVTYYTLRKMPRLRASLLTHAAAFEGVPRRAAAAFANGAGALADFFYRLFDLCVALVLFTLITLLTLLPLHEAQSLLLFNGNFWRVIQRGMRNRDFVEGLAA